ncbi:hypothetical protein [Methylogaea oryzae]|nr:hypothetical protein [Methylogaea oryzae]
MLRDELPETAQRELARHQNALAAYRGQNWTLAEKLFGDLRQAYPERLLYQIYQERAVHFLQHPPDADWDGVFTFQTK